jgi:CspA family cold shock protein
MAKALPGRRIAICFATRTNWRFDDPAITGRNLESMSMSQSGTVKFFNTEKGFGFIKPDNGGPDIFVHISAVQASGLNGLTENQKVNFDTEPDKRGKGPKAVNLRAG